MEELYDFESVYAYTYRAKCAKCGREIEVRTQKDDNPEGYTLIFVRCSCGGSAQFELPFN